MVEGQEEAENIQSVGKKERDGQRQGAHLCFHRFMRDSERDVRCAKRACPTPAPPHVARTRAGLANQQRELIVQKNKSKKPLVTFTFKLQDMYGSQVQTNVVHWWNSKVYGHLSKIFAKKNIYISS